MSISAVTPRPASSRVAARWRIVAAALTLIGLMAVVITLMALSISSGPGPTIARPASVHSGYFRDPGLHALTPLSDQAIAFPKADVAVSRPRP
jgi:hypothetical protein